MYQLTGMNEVWEVKFNIKYVPFNIKLNSQLMPLVGDHGQITHEFSSFKSIKWHVKTYITL
jgi:hypothetical protein